MYIYVYIDVYIYITELPQGCLLQGGFFKHLNKTEKDIFSLIPEREKDYYLTKDE